MVVIRLRWMSNFTDVDALAAEPGVSVRYTPLPADVERADLVVLPGTKATVEDLRRLRDDGLDDALRPRAEARSSASAAATRCSGHRIEDGVESADSADGLGLLDLNTPSRPRSCCARSPATVWGVPATGYEIRHGRVDRDEPLIQHDDVLGTAWHGLLEGDAIRRKILQLGRGADGPRLDARHDRVQRRARSPPRPSRRLVRRATSTPPHCSN